METDVMIPVNAATIGLFLTILLNIFVVIWGAATVTTKLKANTTALSVVVGEMDLIATRVGKQGERIATLEGAAAAE